MIRIYKNNDTKVVTKGAYEQFYKSLGYNIILEAVEVVDEVVTESNTDAVEEVKETVSRPKRSSSNKRNKKAD